MHADGRTRFVVQIYDVILYVVLHPGFCHDLRTIQRINMLNSVDRLARADTFAVILSEETPRCGCPYCHPERSKYFAVAKCCGVEPDQRRAREARDLVNGKDAPKPPLQGRGTAVKRRAVPLRDSGGGVASLREGGGILQIDGIGAFRFAK